MAKFWMITEAELEAAALCMDRYPAKDMTPAAIQHFADTVIDLADRIKAERNWYLTICQRGGEPQDPNNRPRGKRP